MPTCRTSITHQQPEPNHGSNKRTQDFANMPHCNRTLTSRKDSSTSREDSRTSRQDDKTEQRGQQDQHRMVKPAERTLDQQTRQQEQQTGPAERTAPPAATTAGTADRTSREDSRTRDRTAGPDAMLTSLLSCQQVTFAPQHNHPQKQAQLIQPCTIHPSTVSSSPPSKSEPPMPDELRRCRGRLRRCSDDSTGKCS